MPSNTSSLGKQFENHLRKQLEKQSNVAVLRLYDVTMGYKGINNPCDFIVYKKPKMIMLECKTKKGHLLNFSSDIRPNQWNKLLEFSKIKGIEAGILVWFYEQHKTFYLNIQDLEYLRYKGKKSFDCEKDIPTVILYGKRKKVFYEYYLEKFMKELIYEE